MFIDVAKILIKAGDGGDGAVAFRREKFVPKGGPAGGNGGNGGNIYFVADSQLHTLLDFKYKRKFIAPDGANGGKNLKDGKGGADVIIKVPVGTIIKDAENSKVLFDIDQNNKKVIALKGGRGGKGNSNFATATRQTPQFAQPGKQGDELSVQLELKLIADVGLVGFPNAGKSTFISAVSAAKPKIADYPFTTLVPNLGIVKYKDFQNFTIADIPGIIEGAHEGKGLGHQFLRHIERTKVLLFLIDITDEDYEQQYNILSNELLKFNKELSDKKRIVAISKFDLVDEDANAKLNKLKLKNYDSKIFFISSASREGIKELVDYLWKALEN